MEEMQISDIESFELQMRLSVGASPQRAAVKVIADISNEIPSNMNLVTKPQAEYLAGQFLRGMDLCGDVVAMAVKYEHQLETLKKKEFSTAYLSRASQSGFKTQKDKEFFAFQDEEYLKVCEAYGAAKAFRIMVGQKHSAFEKAHHMMRKLAEGAMSAGSEISMPSDHTESDDFDWGAGLR